MSKLNVRVSKKNRAIYMKQLCENYNGYFCNLLTQGCVTFMISGKKEDIESSFDIHDEESVSELYNDLKRRFQLRMSGRATLFVKENLHNMHILYFSLYGL